jgi:MULE transposase domain
MFATDDGMQILTEAKTWFCDGNFNLSPTFFLQLYVIRVPKNDFYITAVYCLLERKTTSIYEEMFNLILSKCAERDLFPDPTHINCDFKKALISAAQNVFDTNLTIRGCFYHLCQSSYRKIQDLGLTNMYKNVDKFNHFCGMLDGLAFLPLEYVFKGMDYLKTIVPTEGEELLNYFDTTYVNGSFRKVGAGTTFKLKKVSPLFPPDTWNVHETTIVGDHRTNNICESWNNRFTHLVGHSHPTIWTLIRKIKHEVGADTAKLAVNSMGERNKKKQQNTTQNRLQTLCQRILDNDITIEEFLNKIGHNIRSRPRSE